MRYAMLLLPLVLGACATGFGDNKVSIVTAGNGQQFGGASCTVLTNSDRWTVTTPATLTIPANGELRVVCNKAGYRMSEVRLPPFGQSGSNMGVGLGGGSGAVGMGVGFSLPIGTGGGSYPPRIVVDMYPQ